MSINLQNITLYVVFYTSFRQSLNFNFCVKNPTSLFYLTEQFIRKLVLNFQVLIPRKKVIIYIFEINFNKFKKNYHLNASTT